MKPDDRHAYDLLRSTSNAQLVHVIENYLYFPDERVARTVADILAQQGFGVTFRRGADRINWLVLATAKLIPTESAMDEMCARFEKLAEEHQGEHDGWEAIVQQGPE